ncbi:hypothetical protein N7463_000938 [Penicillium fimorum]|uniref:Protein kinase domain-containing protein n=1 Tax=Penicillium fimorum TaxID=1882269 RepID=A0A9W9Y597_9EURO|nr:hypothetical protein N7463_000938 [Penicillium fimorum]
MSGAELGLAILSTIDICLKYGKIIVSKYRSIRDSDSEIEERTLSIEAAWIKISQQLAFLKRVWETLGEDYQELQGRILRILQRKLETSVSLISKLERGADHDGNGLLDKRKAAKYAFLVKDALHRAIQDLKEWQKEFDTTWYLIMRIADCTIDSELTKRPATDKLSTARRVRDMLRPAPQRPTSVFLPGGKLGSAQINEISYSTSKIITTSDASTFVLDSVDCSARNDASTLAKDVRRLAVKLQQIDANEFHLLRCHGVVRNVESYSKQLLSYDFIFNMPAGCSQPQSLRNLMLYRENSTLSDRLRVAKQFATAIHYIHVLDFVHKNIRPETVLIFRNEESGLDQLFLLGFQAFRLADGKTLRLGGSTWSENVYQHPNRQGSHPTTDYVMQYDIYSLGVCLLEIGLWDSLVSSEGLATPSLIPTDHDSLVSATKNSLKDHYTSLAKQRLPFTMGDKYAGVVVNCLSCMDLTNPDFGDASEFEDEDGIMIGVRYIEKV